MDITDSKLIERFEKLIDDNPNYWDFKEAKKEHIHGICTYPATMVPVMQSEILKCIINLKPDINSLLDPFMGSGTVLVEGMINNLDVYGIDINPFSYLLSEFKINIPLVKRLEKCKEFIFDFLNSEQEYDIKSFKGINKWYRDDIIENLSKISEGIRRIEIKSDRQFFWICLAEVSRLSNNSRNSTFKLHTKTDEDIKRFEYDTITNFKKIVNKNLKRISDYIEINRNLQSRNSNIYEYSREKKVFLGNSIEELKKNFHDGSIDLIITSPPYGDNQTTVTYGQFSVLPLRWIDKSDVSEEIWESIIETYSKIDDSSLGGKKYKIEDIEQSNILNNSDTLNSIYKDLIDKEEVNKAKKVASFMLDFSFIIEELSRVLRKNGYIVLTVGNRRVSNKEVKFNKIIKDLARLYDLKLIYEFDRNILCKRIPNKISKLKDNTSVKSMSKEYILILKKE